MQLTFDYRPGEDLPFSAHRRLREAGPVVWCETLNGWLVSSYEDARAVLGDVVRFTSAGIRPDIDRYRSVADTRSPFSPSGENSTFDRTG